MKNRIYIHVICFHIFMPLVVGGMIYLLFRPSTLLMFKFFEYYNVSIFKDEREIFKNFVPLLPEWVIFSLPNALWVYSMSAYIALVWKNKINRTLWVYSVYILSLLAELLQLSNIIPGTFSIADILLILIACFVNQIFIYYKKY